MIKNTLYTHYKNKQKYAIIDVCEYQHKNIWYEGVIYKDVESGKNYCRKVVDFDLKFKVVEG